MTKYFIRDYFGRQRNEPTSYEGCLAILPCLMLDTMTWMQQSQSHLTEQEKATRSTMTIIVADAE